LNNVPVIILCGGRGTRMGPATHLMPKPMLPIGERPVLWHIMKIYASYGHTDFVLALGWLGEEIRKFFLNYEALTSDFTVELGRTDSITYLGGHPETGWRVTCLDTGRETLTGTRLRQAADHVDAETVMLTYGDGVGDIDVDALLKTHKDEGRLGTITIVHPPGRFGEVRSDEAKRVVEFSEKPQTSVGAISGGFMVLEKSAIERYIPAGEDVMFERTLLPGLARDQQLTAYTHDGFWQPMDTPREQELLESLWHSGEAPWKVWT
jgi:glucose-1-phosphate cytidylyltransferase